MGFPLWCTLTFSTLLLRGAGMAINRDTTSTLETRSSWTHLGCYTDNVSGRALSNGVQVSGGAIAMTNELCQGACQAAGFSMAGTEYAQECCKTFFSYFESCC